MARLLVVEDQRETNEALCEYMRHLGHEARPAYNGAEALEIFHSEGTELIILDMMIPKITGLGVLHEIRRKSNVPVIMLTAVEDEYTQAISFDEQADDYITKPFSMLLLGKRVAALLRRNGKAHGAVAFGEFTVDFSGYSAKGKNGKVDVTPKEIDLLRLLWEHRGQVLTRQQILDALWGDGYPIIDRTIDTYIKNLRKKLALNSIVTVKGIGYKLEAEK